MFGATRGGGNKYQNRVNICSEHSASNFQPCLIVVEDVQVALYSTCLLVECFKHVSCRIITRHQTSNNWSQHVHLAVIFFAVFDSSKTLLPPFDKFWPSCACRFSHSSRFSCIWTSGTLKVRQAWYMIYWECCCQLFTALFGIILCHHLLWITSG